MKSFMISSYFSCLGVERIQAACEQKLKGTVKMVYKLTYFDVKGIAEGIRMLLHYVGQDYEDIRLKVDDWKDKKSTMPMGVLPVFEHDGKKLSQSVAIALYIGQQHGMVPKDQWQQIKVLELALGWLDIMPKFTTLFATQEKNAKKEKYEEIMKDFIHPRMKLYEEHLAHSKSGYLADQLCYADFFVYGMFGLSSYMFETDMKQYKHIHDFMKKIESLPKVKDYMSTKAPKGFTPFPPFKQQISAA